MNRDDISCFYEVAACKGIRKASERLDMAPSAVSRQIARLESELDIKLFDRNSRSMTLTPAGEIYLNYVEGIRLGKQVVLEELDALKGLKTGHVRVHSIEGYAAELVAASVVGFRQRYPGISFELAIDGSDRIIAAVVAGKTDIGLALSPEPVASVECAIRIPAPLVAVMWPGHPLAGHASVSLAELVRHPIVLPPADTGIRHVLDAVCRIEKLRAAPVLVTTSVSAMKTFVVRRGGVAILARVSVLSELEAGVMVAVPLADPLLARTTIDICVLGRRKLSPAVGAYLRHLRGESQTP